MHGTYRLHIEGGAGLRASRHASSDGPWRRSRRFLRTSSCLMLAAGFALLPANRFLAESLPAHRTVVIAAEPRSPPAGESRLPPGIEQPFGPTALATILPPERPEAIPATAAPPAPPPAKVDPAPEPAPVMLAVARVLPAPAFVVPPPFRPDERVGETPPAAEKGVPPQTPALASVLPSAQTPVPAPAAPMANPSPLTPAVLVPWPEPTPVVLAVAPVVSATPTLAPPSPPRRDMAAPDLRPVDIAQVADAGMRSLHVPQLNEPGLVAGGGVTLAAKVDAMQVRLPAGPRLTDGERAALLAEAPSEMTVRIGGEAVGKVAFRVTEASTIDVQLSGLLDLVAGRMAPEEFSRLRNSAAAGSYVPLDQLRAIGLSLRYDAVYDELDLSA